jgi:hypothetical protein
MPKPPYKQIEVRDQVTPERLATFTRPSQDDDAIVIQIHNPGCFHLDAGTLKLVADLLHVGCTPHTTYNN